MTLEQLCEYSKKWLGTGETSADAQHIQDVAEAIFYYVDNLPDIDRNPDGTWAPNTCQGAKMLVSRLVRRRNSIGGIESITETNVAYVARRDEDIDKCLHLGKYAKPKII